MHNFWCQEMISSQHAQMWHVEPRDWQSSIASNGERAEKKKISRQYKNITGKVEKVMRFLKDKDEGGYWNWEI